MPDRYDFAERVRAAIGIKYGFDDSDPISSYGVGKTYIITTKDYYIEAYDDGYIIVKTDGHKYKFYLDGTKCTCVVLKRRFYLDDCDISDVV